MQFTIYLKKLIYEPQEKETKASINEKEKILNINQQKLFLKNIKDLIKDNKIVMIKEKDMEIDLKIKKEFMEEIKIYLVGLKEVEIVDQDLI